jgi:hypothetical protein
MPQDQRNHIGRNTVDILCKRAARGRLDASLAADLAVEQHQVPPAGVTFA